MGAWLGLVMNVLQTEPTEPPLPTFSPTLIQFDGAPVTMLEACWSVSFSAIQTAQSLAAARMLVSTVNGPSPLAARAALMLATNADSSLGASSQPGS